MNASNPARERAYLDHAASSPLRPQALAALTAQLDLPGNPASTHTAGRRARKALEEARESIAHDLGAQPTEIIFTAGGTEADNIAVLGSWLARRDRRNAILITSVEHPAIARAAQAAADQGASIRLIGVDASGRIDLDGVRHALDDQVALASVQWANAETGTVQPVAELAAAAAEHDVWFHSDAVHGLVSGTVDFAAAGLDLMSVSAHKIGGPVGIGALVAKKTVRPSAIGFGGAQERELRSGTVPVALASAFAAALRAAVAQAETDAASFAGYRQRILAALARIPDARVNGQAPQSSSVINLVFPGLRSDDLLLVMDAEGIDVSAGSACHAGVARPSEVLVAMGLPDDLASAALRISFGHSTSSGDIDRLVEVLPDAVARARRAYEFGASRKQN